MIKNWSDLNDFLLDLESRTGHNANAMIVASDVDRIGIRVHTTPEVLPRPMWYEAEFDPKDLQEYKLERVARFIALDIESHIEDAEEREELRADVEGHEHPGVLQSVSNVVGKQPRPEQDGDPQEREDRREGSGSADPGEGSD